MKSFPGWPPTWSIVLLLPALFLGFTVHELAHAIVAYLLGDTSQVERRRLSFNPLRHVSWLGMIAFMLIGVGWARPVWVDYTRFRIKNRPLGIFLVSVAGAISNLVFALLALAGITATVGITTVLGDAPPADALLFLVVQEPQLNMQGLAAALSSYVFSVNLVLAIFNLLPIPPLDGFAAVVGLFNVIRNAIKGDGRAQPSPQTREVAAGGGSAPSPARIHFTIGLDYHKRGLLDEAVVRYRQAIEHDPRFALAFYNLGLAYLTKGRLTLATGAFRAVLQHSPDSGLWALADLRLRELAGAEQQPDAPAPPRPAPAPLELAGPLPAPAVGPPPLDPAIARQVWLRLGIGGVVFVVLLVASWVFVTVATFMGVG